MNVPKNPVLTINFAFLWKILNWDTDVLVPLAWLERLGFFIYFLNISSPCQSRVIPVRHSRVISVRHSSQAFQSHFSQAFQGHCSQAFQSNIPVRHFSKAFLLLLFNFSYAMLMSKVVAKTNAGKLSIP